MVDILHSRVSYDPDWGPQTVALRDVGQPRLVNHWPPPDLANPSLRRVLTDRIGGAVTVAVNAVAIAPDGSWLVTGATDWSLRTWDAVTGQQRAVLTGHTGEVTAVAIAPDGSWLASGSTDNTVRIWDIATRRTRATLTGHTGQVSAVAIAPDGSWLATGSSDKTRGSGLPPTDRATLPATPARFGVGHRARRQLARLRQRRRHSADLGHSH